MLYIHIIVCFAVKHVSVAHKYLRLRFYSWECSWGERVILGVITTQINQSRGSVCLSVVKFTLPLLVDFLLNQDSRMFTSLKRLDYLMLIINLTTIMQTKKGVFRREEGLV